MKALLARVAAAVSLAICAPCGAAQWRRAHLASHEALDLAAP